MKKGILTVIILLLVLAGGIFLYMKNPTFLQLGNSTTNETNSTGTNNVTTPIIGINPENINSSSETLTVLSSDTDSSEPNDAPVTSDSGVVDSSGLN
jgi:hypothetical protein